MSKRCRRQRRTPVVTVILPHADPSIIAWGVLNAMPEVSPLMEPLALPMSQMVIAADPVRFTEIADAARAESVVRDFRKYIVGDADIRIEFGVRFDVRVDGRVPDLAVPDQAAGTDVPLKPQRRDGLGHRAARRGNLDCLVRMAAWFACFWALDGANILRVVADCGVTLYPELLRLAERLRHDAV